MIALSMSLGVGNGAAKTASGPLTPPTVAPVLIANIYFADYTARLEWTASNKTNSDGFGYRVEVSINGGSFSLVASLTANDFAYNDQQYGATGETYTYRVTPFNAAGDGPVSNTASVIIPGV